MTNKGKAAISIGAAIAAIWLYRTNASRRPVPSVTTSEGFDLSPYGGPVVYPQSIKDLAQAIARAEGFYVAGSISQRANNPGDIKVPNWPGATLGEGISVFPSADQGWNQLYKQLYAILTGRSAVYSLDDTIRTMADKWTGGDNPAAWSRNVATFLAKAETAPLWSVLA